MSALTTTQETVLKAAAAREDGSIHPMPTNLKGIILKKVVDSLRTKGLIATDADTISEDGYRAIGMETPKTTALTTNGEAPVDI